MLLGSSTGLLVSRNSRLCTSCIYRPPPLGHHRLAAHAFSRFQLERLLVVDRVPCSDNPREHRNLTHGIRLRIHPRLSTSPMSIVSAERLSSHESVGNLCDRR